MEKKFKLAELKFEASKDKSLTQSNESITGRANIENGSEPNL